MEIFESDSITIYYKNANYFRFLDNPPDMVEIVKIEFEITENDCYITNVENAMYDFIEQNKDKLIIFNKIKSFGAREREYFAGSAERYFDYVLNKIFSIIDVIDYNILCSNRLDEYKIERVPIPMPQTQHMTYYSTYSNFDNDVLFPNYNRRIVIVINDCLGRMLTSFRRYSYHDVNASNLIERFACINHTDTMIGEICKCSNEPFIQKTIQENELAES